MASESCIMPAWRYRRSSSDRHRGVSHHSGRCLESAGEAVRQPLAANLANDVQTCGDHPDTWVEP